MKKIIRYIKNKIQHSKHQLKINKQISDTRELRTKGLSDTDRWHRNEVFYDDWNERTRILGKRVSPRARVIEFGAGNAYLRNHLPDSVTYTPSDLIKREDDFLICDLNKGIDLDLRSYDTVILSGVLEYVYDIDRVFNRFPNNIEYVILSYACKNICSVDRLANGWLSDYTQKELEDVFQNNNYMIQERLKWKQQSIYLLKRGL